MLIKAMGEFKPQGRCARVCYTKGKQRIEGELELGAPPH